MFLIPRIPGTGWLALLGVGLVAMTVISAAMRSIAEPPPAPAVEDDEPSPVAVWSVRLDGEPDAVIALLGAEPIGHEMWRWQAAESAIVLLLEDDGLWAHDLADADVALLAALGVAYTRPDPTPEAP
jgi:hypothetical protein